MSLAALCPRRSTALSIMAASDEAGLRWRTPQLEVPRFLDELIASQPRFALVAHDYLNDPNLFVQVRAISPQTLLIVCVTINPIEPQAVWALIDELDIDVVCTLPELPACLQTLNCGKFYKSSLVQLPNSLKPSATLPGLADLTPAEQRVLRGICEQKTGPQIAEALLSAKKRSIITGIIWHRSYR